MKFKSLSDWAKTVQKVNSVASYRAMNKTFSKVLTQFKRDVREATGLKTSDTKKRFSLKKASLKYQYARISFGTKFGVSASLFKPKLKIVRGPKKRKYNGVSIKAGASREIVPNAWLWNAPSGKPLVLTRKTKTRRPTAQVRVSLYQAVQPYQKSLVNFARSEFKKQFSQQLIYEVKKRK